MATGDFVVRVVLAVLATWRISHLLAEEDGPADLILRLRRRLGDGMLGALMDCFFCLSLWVAVPLTFLLTNDPLMWVVCWLAVSGAACLLQRLTAPPVQAPQPMEGDDDVLR